MDLQGDGVSEDQVITSLKLSFANTLLFWTTLFLVKASFLVTYHIIFGISRTFRKVWWCVAVYVGVSFAAIILITLWCCGNPTSYDSPQACRSSSDEFHVQVQALWIALNVLGDFLLIALPLSMLRKLQMSNVYKWCLAGIFAVVILEVLFDVLRFAYSIEHLLGRSTSTYVAAEWDACEPAVAVIVCALPSYRSLLPRQASRRCRPSEHAQNQKAMSGQVGKSEGLSETPVLSSTSTQSERPMV